MKGRFARIAAMAAALLALAATPAVAGSTQGTFLLVMEAPNFGRAPNGDRVVVTGDGSFSVHPKSVQASGEFTHLDPAGNPRGGGTWTATELLIGGEHHAVVRLGGTAASGLTSPTSAAAVRA